MKVTYYEQTQYNETKRDQLKAQQLGGQNPVILFTYVEPSPQYAWH